MKVLSSEVAVNVKSGTVEIGEHYQMTDTEKRFTQNVVEIDKEAAIEMAHAILDEYEGDERADEQAAKIGDRAAMIAGV